MRIIAAVTSPLVSLRATWLNTIADAGAAMRVEINRMLTAMKASIADAASALEARFHRVEPSNIATLRENGMISAAPFSR